MGGSARWSLHVALLFAGVLATGVQAGREVVPQHPSSTEAPTYTSHYLVFGTGDASGTPRLLALDFNRTEQGDGQVAYEYKLFVARDGDWSMPVYETWEEEPDAQASSFPARGGLTPTVTENGVLRVTAELPGLSLQVRPTEPSFPFPADGERSAAGTGHPEFVVRWNGTTFRGPGVYERIRSTPAADRAEEAAAEDQRQLDEEASFGLFDWIVLYDDRGRLWHISQGTLSRDFAYQQATDSLPRETHDVLVRWLATEYDEMAKQHSPTTWLVDVPAWEMRVRLRWTGEHRGHGHPRDDGTRPVYVQASVDGRGLIQGEEHQFFGMVEHIRD